MCPPRRARKKRLMEHYYKQTHDVGCMRDLCDCNAVVGILAVLPSCNL